MSLARRIVGPVSGPVRRKVNHYVRFFEDLIHAIKSEIIGKIEHVDGRVEGLQHSVAAGQDAVADQISMQAATLRSLRDEVEQLRELTEALERRLSVAEAQGGELRVDELAAAGS